MASFSRDSLQWNTAVKTFISIVVSGLVTISIVSYLSFSQLGFNASLVIYFSLAIAVLLLLAVGFSFQNYQALSRPLSSLETITDTFPLLSSKKYNEAREIFKNVENNNAVHSNYQEINQLQFATMQLTGLLEKLDANVNERSGLIHKKNEELQTERDFIKNLLDTAQLIILTVNNDLDITLFNDYGEKITGFKEFELLNTSVSRMFPAGSWIEAQDLFNELLLGNMQIAQMDTELIDKEGIIRQVSWLHSRIENNSNDVAILSVGLDMTEKKEAEKRIIWMAEHDPLTDLCNRRRFTEEFEKSLQTAIRYKHNNSLLFLDLDQFKDINDTSGHRAGDELLQSVAKNLLEVTRLSDLVARLGGDEFAILIPESDYEGAQALAKKIINALSLIQLSFGTVKHKVSASIGIVHYPLHDATVHELLGFADLAMYKAKADGKGTFHTYSADDQTKEQLETRVFWKQQIEHALENDTFVLYYQPILEIKSNTIQHYEVLIRMRDEKTGELRLPGKFIEIAEQVGLIHHIDHYVLQKSMMKLATLQKQGVPVRLAINLSGAVIDDPEMLPLLKEFMKKYDVKPEGLIFEVTETAAVSNLQQAKALMTAIKVMGCQFSLDDFGVGFASFNYMRELPVDIIKIDGIFIKDLDKNADDQLFVKALVDVAKGLGKKTIAEFVENREILTLLRSYGVDYAQGYHIGRPDSGIRDGVNWQAE